MSKIDAGQAINILANLGVIAGIVFLAIELNQDQELARAQMRNEIAQGIVDVLAAPASSLESADVIARGLLGEQLTAAESQMFASFAESALRYWENAHYQYRQQLYDNVEFSRHLDTIETRLTKSPGLADFYCPDIGSIRFPLYRISICSWRRMA